ncbi:hypothetical protein BC941DRAFT_441990 [Chlamydoabsidia padenii]|nr:hypothetical protein BC941DRAFT_441990 [Chlamydoabsidia padenii]
MSGAPIRMKKEDARKIEQGIKQLETSIPTPKTMLSVNYILHAVYMNTHLHTFFGFYGFRTASINWANYYGRQEILDLCTNILIDGSKKYNQRARQKRKTNKRKRKKIRPRRRPEGERNNIPLVVFGDGLKNKESVRFRGLRHVCNSCQNHTNMFNFVRPDRKHIHQILICNDCNIYWNRDVMAAKNMCTIATSILAGNGRPYVCTRQRQLQEQQEQQEQQHE